jgi:hypothetical protein
MVAALTTLLVGAGLLLLSEAGKEVGGMAIDSGARDVLRLIGLVVSGLSVVSIFVAGFCIAGKKWAIITAVLLHSSIVLLEFTTSLNSRDFTGIKDVTISLLAVALAVIGGKNQLVNSRA